MLQRYLDLLKNATDAMGNLGHSGAGFPEYAKAVGYEFLLLGLGILYLAVVVAIIAAPIMFIRKVVIKGCFSSEKWKKYMNIRNKMYEFSLEYTKRIREIYHQNSKSIIAEKLKALCEFLKEAGYEFDEDLPNFNEIAKSIKKGKSDAFTEILPDISPYEERFKPARFYGSVMNYNELLNLLNVQDNLAELFSTEADFDKTYAKHIFKLCAICIFALIIYLMFLVPFILVFF